MNNMKNFLQMLEHFLCYSHNSQKIVYYDKERKILECNYISKHLTKNKIVFLKTL